MPHSRTHQDPVQLSRSTAERVARNAHGQSLDDAREIFRTEWQAKIDLNREQAEQERRRAISLGRAPEYVYLAGATGGGIIGGSWVASSLGLWGFPLGAFAGALLGCAFLSPAVFVVIVARLSSLRAVKRLEREVEELERS